MRGASLALIAILLLPLTIHAAEVVSLNGGAAPLSVEILESTVERTVVRYDLGAFTRAPVDIDGETYYSIGLPGESKILVRGLPELPNIARSIVIPDDAEMAVSIVSSHYVEFTGVPVSPSKGLITRDVDPATVPYSFRDFYESEGWYPDDLASIREPYILRDVRGTVIVLNPFHYNPSTETLRVYDNVIVEVEAVGPGRINVLERRPGARMDSEFRKIYERHFLNAESVRHLRYTPVEEAGNMLVICYGSFMSSMEPLVEWRKQMGIPCEMVSVTDAGTTSSGIAAYIDTYYHSNGLTYVLLVGDAAQVPTPYAAGGSSDPSYSLVAGSDSYPDLFVGRFSAESAAHVETQVLRTIEYEKLPQAGGDWYHKGTGIASNQGPGDDGEYDDEHVDNIRTDLLAFTYTEVGRIYDPSATASMVTDALNDGRSIINYTGHGSTSSWGSSGFSSSDVNALVNDNMLPFIISVACVNGYFNGVTCFAETWLRATNGTEPTGAIATYMSSINQSWEPPMEAQDEVVDLLVGTSAYGAKRTFGGLCYNGSCQMMDEYGGGGESMFLTWHIFGDPSLRVRTDTPTALSVIHDGNIDPSATTFDVSVPGVEGALCALYYDGTLYGAALTNAAGNASIAIGEEPPTDVDLTLTVTSFNAIPYFAGVHVGQTYVPVIDSDPGYFDVVLEPEETRVETLLIHNVGEPLSILHFDIEIVDAGTVRNLTGSTVSASPTSYLPGGTAGFVFSVVNASFDDEWINGASLDFPPGVTVNSCTNLQVSDRSLAWDGATGNGALVTWSGDYANVIYPGETAVVTVDLTIDAGFTGDLEAAFGLDGDGYGSEPHSVSGTVVIDPPSGPTVAVTSPNGGEVWGVGESHDITWQSTGALSFVALSCSSDSGATWDPIISSTENDGLYPWLVGAPVSNTCYIKIAGLVEPPVEDVSNASFSVYRPVDWLTAVPVTGDLPSGGTQVVELMFDTGGLAEGDYYADIMIDSNGGDRIIIPVALHVQATGVEADVPLVSVLYGNYPNPFNPSTSISFSIPQRERVRVSIFDITGRLVRALADDEFEKGPHDLPWGGTNDAGEAVGSGVYFYRVEAGSRVLEGKMVLTK